MNSLPDYLEEAFNMYCFIWGKIMTCWCIDFDVNLVSFESRYGIYFFIPGFSFEMGDWEHNALITFPRADKERFICLASDSRWPSASVCKVINLFISSWSYHITCFPNHLRTRQIYKMNFAVNFLIVSTISTYLLQTY